MYAIYNHPLWSRKDETLAFKDTEFVKGSNGSILLMQYFKELAFKLGKIPNEVHLNFCGNIEKTEIRREFAIPDSNMFVTSFVVYTLLQSQKMGTIQPDVEVIDSAVEAITTYSDKNGVSGHGIYNFWPQVFNETSGFYVSYPTNLNGLIDMFGGLQAAVDFIADLLKEYKVVTDMAFIERVLQQILAIFHIPPDADDTGGALALGRLIKEFESTYPQAAATWASNNSDVGATIAGYQAFAYRPFADTIDANGIDPRTYYALQEFLQLWTTDMGRSPSSLVLPGTWFLNISSQVNTFPDLQMPFNVNNVDFSVAMNSLFGIASAAYDATNSSDILTPDVSDMLTSITLLIEWSVNSGMVYNRTDITLLYYPSVYGFSWFIARTVFFLQEYSLAKALPAPLDFVLDTLSSLSEGNVTTQLLARMEKDGNTGVYWDDFLGQDDTLFGEPIRYGDDRFFSSSLALNTLFDTWTLPVAQQPGARQWKANTPSTIRSAIHLASAYINANILNHPEQTFNSFFSGSLKGMSTFAIFYPSNYCYLINGTQCDPHISNPSEYEMIAAMSGVVSEATYQELVKEKWVNESTPTNWISYNPSPFPFWSSKPLTYSLSILALSKAIILNA
eukprot:gene9146-10731_t